MENEIYSVYARVRADGAVIEMNSSAFLHDATGWTEIDKGTGDRFHHAQGNYLPGPPFDERGIPRYKLVDGEVVERTKEEMDGEYIPPVAQPTAEELLAALMGGVADA